MMFALMVIQQQLRRIEGGLARLEARMSAVEQRVADLDEPTPAPQVSTNKDGTATRSWMEARMPSAAANASAMVTSMSR